MKTLQEIWLKMPLQSDKGDIHSYLNTYESILSPYRLTAKHILEIGLFNGASLLLWEQYFPGTVHGIDCSETPHDGMADLRPLIAEGTHNIHIMDGTSESAIQKEFGDMKWDVVIDDGSHQLEHQLQTVNIFKHRLSENGIIIIEDIQNLDKDRCIFEGLDMDVQIIDLRRSKNRYDDVLIILKNKK